MLCVECGAEMRWTDEPVAEVFKGMEFTVEGVRRYVCDSCGNDEMDVEEAEKLSRELSRRYAEAQGLLTPKEIRNLRKQLGLNQKEFEKLLKVSSPTVSRWETGAMQQSKQADELMRIYMSRRDVLEDALERAEIHHVPKCSIELPTVPVGWQPRPEFKSKSPKMNIENAKAGGPFNTTTANVTVGIVTP